MDKILTEVKVSVIIPVYNVEKYIVECLEKITNQTMKNIEIIVVNDGTKDSSILKIEEYLKDKRVKLINKKNGGLSSARNAGIKAATGKYLFHVDSDDYIELDTIQKLYTKAEENDLDVVVCDIKIFGEGIKTRIWQDTSFKEDEIFTGKEYLEQYFLGNGSPAIWNKLWKRRLYIENKICHPENISYGEDGATMPKLMINAQKVGKINRAFCNYRQQRDSMMSKKGKKVMEYITVYDLVSEYLMKVDKKWFEKYRYTFKLNYVYDHLLLLNRFSKEVKKNEEYRFLYKNFLFDIKNTEEIYIKNEDIKGKIKSIIYKTYKKSVFRGEIYKIGYRILRCLKR